MNGGCLIDRGGFVDSCGDIARTAHSTRAQLGSTTHYSRSCQNVLLTARTRRGSRQPPKPRIFVHDSQRSTAGHRMVSAAEAHRLRGRVTGLATLRCGISLWVFHGASASKPVETSGAPLWRSAEGGLRRRRSGYRLFHRPSKSSRTPYPFGLLCLIKSTRRNAHSPVRAATLDR